MIINQHKNFVFVVVWLAFFTHGCANVPNNMHRRNVTKKNIIPADAFYKKRSSDLQFKLSPNGQFVSGITIHNNKISILITSSFSNRHRIINTQKNHIITQHEWLADNHRIVFSQPVDDSNQHIFIADLNKPDQLPQDITPSRTGWWNLAHVGTRDRNKIWIWNMHGSRYVNLEVVDLITQETKVENTALSPVTQWLFDTDDRLRGRISYNYTSRFMRYIELYDPINSTWNTIITSAIDEVIHFLGFDADNKSLWLLTNHDREFVELVKFYVESGEEKVICQDLNSDIHHVTMSHKFQKPLLAYSCPDYPRVFFLDDNTEALLKPYQPAPNNGFTVVDVDHDENLFAFLTYDCKMVDAYIFDRRTRQIDLIADSGAILYSSWLTNKKPISIAARDGMLLNGYITFPLGAASEPGPTILLVHGGPWQRDKWEYDYLAQFLANRGYVVLQINFRGSSGYGKIYMRKAIGEFGRSMHSDLIDCMQWAVDKGYSDPQRTAIMGWSYGGYAALVGLTLTPDLFRCAIAIAGVSDLSNFISANYRNRNLAMTHWWRKYVGNPFIEEDKKRMMAVSPIHHVEKITRPLLIVHGGDDKIVSSEESEKMVVAMKEAGKEVEYLFFPDEGHSFDNFETFSVLFKTVDEFLDANLKAEH